MSGFIQGKNRLPVTCATIDLTKKATSECIFNKIIAKIQKKSLMPVNGVITVQSSLQTCIRICEPNIKIRQNCRNIYWTKWLKWLERQKKKIENVKLKREKRKSKMYMVLVTKCHNYTKLALFLIKHSINKYSDKEKQNKLKIKP